jgi:hypothetical protein
MVVEKALLMVAYLVDVSAALMVLMRVGCSVAAMDGLGAAQLVY